LVKVNYKDVIAVESRQNYVLIHTAVQNIMAYMSLTEISALLAPLPDLVKYHRSFIINKEHIVSVTGNTIRMSNGLQVTVGDHYRKDFMEYLEQRLLKAGRKT
jgi:DNA-binding LytR/AlgR family response regulator